MVSDKIYDIDFAKVIMDSINANPSIANLDIVNKLKKIPLNDLVLITKVFNTPKIKIIDVNRIDVDLISKYIKFR